MGESGADYYRYQVTQGSDVGNNYVIGPERHVSVHVCPLSVNGARVKTKQKTSRFVRVGVAFANAC